MKVSIKKLSFESVEDLINYIKNNLIKDLKEDKKSEDESYKPCDKKFSDLKIWSEAMSNLEKKFSCLNMEELCAVLHKIYEVNKAAYISILFKEIALILDRKYENHISECKEVWAFSTVTGKLHKIPTSKVRGFEGFAAFRTLEDAKVPCRLLKTKLRELYAK